MPSWSGAQDRGVKYRRHFGNAGCFQSDLLVDLDSGPDRYPIGIGRRRLIIGGWLVYPAIYFGFGLAQNRLANLAALVIYGAYYGMAYGTAMRWSLI